LAVNHEMVTGKYEEQLKGLKQMPLVKQALGPLQFEELLNELLLSS
jgi:hypothetical protein